MNAKDRAGPETADGMPLSRRLELPYQVHTLALPDFRALTRTLDRVIERYDQPPSTPLSGAKDYLEKFLEKLTSGNWRRTPLSFVTQAASFAFAQESRDVARYEQVRTFLIDEIRASTRESFLSAMVHVYVGSFEPGAAHTRQLARALQEAREQVGLRWRNLLDSVPDVFDAGKVVPHLASLMQQMEDPWHGLRALGLRQPHAPGLMDYVHLEFVKAAQRALTNLPAVQRMVNWLKPPGQSPRRVGAAVAIDALLSPWRERPPPAEVSTLLTDRLTEFYGHPKAGRDAVWNEVDPGLERIFMRWLMHADFRFLFRILREVEPSHMFPDREAFWRVELEAGRVDELWVAFKPEGYRVALERHPAGHNREWLRFGMQAGENDKSLLLMRIGNKIVVDGTHNFKVHIFDASSSQAPRLYQSEYDVRDIRRRVNMDSFAHLGDWQSKTRRRLAQ